jgi:hypothetical protein
VLATVLALTGCDYLRSFETVCDTRLTPASVTVETETPAFSVDLSQPSSALTARGAANSGHVTLGLIETQLASAVNFEANGVVKPLSGRYCMRPSMQVKLAFRPMTIYIAAEHPRGSCEFELTMGHEMKHVRVYEQFLAEMGEEIKQDLRQKFGNRIYYFDSTDAGRNYVQQLTSTALAPYLETGMTEVEKRQRAIDSHEEYFRLDQFQARCGDV